MRVLAVVEGRSEELLLRRLVAPHLAKRAVHLEPMRVLRGRGARGGGSSWQPWQRHLSGLLAGQPNQGVKITTMLDLYRIPSDTPGYTPPDGRGEERAAAMIQAIHAQFGGDWRLIPYIQVHEFEALLYSDLTALTRVEPTLFPEREVDDLAASVSHLAPEAVNGGEATAPSKRILAAMPGFDKVDHGVAAAEAIGLQALRAKCPRFDEWIATLEALGAPQS